MGWLGAGRQGVAGRGDGLIAASGLRRKGVMRLSYDRCFK